MKRILKILLILFLTAFVFAQNSDILSEYRLRKIYFNGNKNFKDRQLKRYIDIKPVRTKRAMERLSYRYIKSQSKSLQNFYVSEGFLNCSVKDSLIVNQENELHLYFNIKEKEQYFIKQISIEGNELLSDGEILELLGLKVGEPFKQYVYYNNLKKILSKYSELGHPFAGIREEYDWDTNMEITLYINEDIPYDIDKINLIGNKSVDAPYIRRHFIIKEGEPYKLDKINRTQDRIYEMGAFNSVNIVPVDPDSSSGKVDLNVSVIESKARRFDFKLGAKQSYGQKISYSSLYLEPEWTHKNLFHRAHRFRVGFTYELQLQNLSPEHLINAEVAYTVPWLFYLRLPTTLKLYYDRMGYDPTVENDLIEGEIQTKYGVNLSSIWRYNRNIYTRGSVSLENFKSEFQSDLNNDPVPFEPQAGISIQSRFDNRNNFIYPSKGWNILLYGGYVLGTETESSTEYFRFEASVNTYNRIIRNMVLATRLEAGQFVNRRDSINATIIYQMGSESTVRGWRKSIGNEHKVIVNDSTQSVIYAGEAKMLANLELRYDLPWNFGFDIFLDAGRLDEDLSTIFNWDTYYVNTGFGIYYRTPIGPIRVEFPIILNDPNIALGRDEDLNRKWYEMINFGLLFAF